MHKAVILLVKAEEEFKDDKSAITDRVREFMEDNHNVWDWYVIGGRWSGELETAKLDRDKLKEYWEKFDELKLGWVSADKKEEDQRAKAWAMWFEYFPDWEGQPIPYRNAYNDEGASGDVIPLSECISIVKEWKENWLKKGEKELADTKKVLAELGDKKPDSYTAWKIKRSMDYMMEIYFTSDANIFNVESDNMEIPSNDELDGWYAVMIDMHN